MRTKLTTICILFTVGLTLTGCWGNLTPQSTPTFELTSNIYLNPIFSGDTLVGAQDTLGTSFNIDSGLEYLDTIQVGDTVVFRALFSAHYNTMVSIVTSTDTNHLDLWFDMDINQPEYKDAFKEGSDASKGILYLNPLYNAVTFPVYLTPLHAGTYPVKFTITSDSKYPESEVKFMVPVIQ